MGGKTSKGKSIQQRPEVPQQHPETPHLDLSQFFPHHLFYRGEPYLPVPLKIKPNLQQETSSELKPPLDPPELYDSIDIQILTPQIISLPIFSPRSCQHLVDYLSKLPSIFFDIRGINLLQYAGFDKLLSSIQYQIEKTIKSTPLCLPDGVELIPYHFYACQLLQGQTDPKHTDDSYLTVNICIQNDRHLCFVEPEVASFYDQPPGVAFIYPGNKIQCSIPAKSDQIYIVAWFRCLFPFPQFPLLPSEVKKAIYFQMDCEARIAYSICSSETLEFCTLPDIWQYHVNSTCDLTNISRPEPEPTFLKTQKDLGRWIRASFIKVTDDLIKHEIQYQMSLVQGLQSVPSEFHPTFKVMIELHDAYLSIFTNHSFVQPEYSAFSTKDFIVLLGHALQVYAHYSHRGDSYARQWPQQAKILRLPTNANSRLRDAFEKIRNAVGESISHYEWGEVVRRVPLDSIYQ